MKSFIELPSNNVITVNSEAQYTAISNYKLENGTLVLKPALVNIIDALRGHYYASTGNVHDGTAVINVQGGDSVSFLAGDIYTDLVIETPESIRPVANGETEPEWITPLGAGVYYMYIHHKDYKSGSVKIIAHESYPYPEF